MNTPTLTPEAVAAEQEFRRNYTIPRPIETWNTIAAAAIAAAERPENEFRHCEEISQLCVGNWTNADVHHVLMQERAAARAPLAAGLARYRATLAERDDLISVLEGHRDDLTADLVFCRRELATANLERYRQHDELATLRQRVLKLEAALHGTTCSGANCDVTLCWTKQVPADEEAGQR